MQISIVITKHKSNKIKLNTEIQENSHLKEKVVTNEYYTNLAIGDIDQYIL